MQMKSCVIPLIEYMHIYNARSLSRIMLAYTLNILVRGIFRRVWNIMFHKSVKFRGNTIKTLLNTAIDSIYKSTSCLFQNSSTLLFFNYHYPFGMYDNISNFINVCVMFLCAFHTDLMAGPRRLYDLFSSTGGTGRVLSLCVSPW